MLEGNRPVRHDVAITGEITLTITDLSGKPAANTPITVRMVRHRFLFGCNAFLIGTISDGPLQRAYEERFAELLNYATLPFYWGSYEREAGSTDEDRLENMAQWCAANHLAAKGHPLVWHETFPQWAQALPDGCFPGPG